MPSASFAMCQVARPVRSTKKVSAGSVRSTSGVVSPVATSILNTSTNSGRGFIQAMTVPGTVVSGSTANTRDPAASGVRSTAGESGASRSTR
ncbi:hypothetical protein [Pseudonocardia parietis]|uniref:Uncharacterized protein n=1 Tax=Pseudonocardia parietis TaxID=570936 RepID=A0ABS4VU20_9PSEU|nr:hypothetical protein [Pseudonocardia parietis]MBP2367445.1 hypothetical protein [Pseudonocardia parietis]